MSFKNEKTPISHRLLNLKYICDIFFSKFESLLQPCMAINFNLSSLFSRFLIKPYLNLNVHYIESYFVFYLKMVEICKFTNKAMHLNILSRQNELKKKLTGIIDILKMIVVCVYT